MKTEPFFVAGKEIVFFLAGYRKHGAVGPLRDQICDFGRKMGSNRFDGQRTRSISCCAATLRIARSGAPNSTSCSASNGGSSPDKEELRRRQTLFNLCAPCYPICPV
jgi:hypothetical protein